MSDADLPHEALEHDQAGEWYRDRQVALLIGVLAVLLALTEILSQQTQVRAVQNNIEASNHWAFFQAKAERETTYSVAADAIGALLPIASEAQRPVLEKTLGKWREASAKLHDDPEKQSGTVQLFNSAKAAEAERDMAEKKHSRYELATAALHIGIVLASASIVTRMPALVKGALGLATLSVLLVIAALVA